MFSKIFNYIFILYIYIILTIYKIILFYQLYI